MAGVHVAGRVGSHLMVVNFDAFRHAPCKVELGGGDARTGRAHQIVPDEFLGKTKEMVGDVDPF